MGQVIKKKFDFNHYSLGSGTMYPINDCWLAVGTYLEAMFEDLYLVSAAVGWLLLLT